MNLGRNSRMYLLQPVTRRHTCPQRQQPALSHLQLHINIRRRNCLYHSSTHGLLLPSPNCIQAIWGTLKYSISGSVLQGVLDWYGITYQRNPEKMGALERTRSCIIIVKRESF